MAVMGMWRGYPPVPVIGQKEPLPNYTGDLNAMHNAEKKLTREQQREYLVRLCVLGKTEWGSFCAPAAARAEAFLRTIWKWKDE
jgi:hypothetical protein